MAGETLHAPRASFGCNGHAHCAPGTDVKNSAVVYVGTHVKKVPHCDFILPHDTQGYNSDADAPLTIYRCREHCPGTLRTTLLIVFCPIRFFLPTQTNMGQPMLNMLDLATSDQ